MPTYDRSRSQTMRHSTNPPVPAHQQADLSPVQALGNQLMQSVQPKLEVNAPNDSYEQEADNFANQVTSAPAQRASKEPEKKKDDKAAQKMPLAAQATPLIQRAGKADEKKKDDKTAQKAGKADDKKKDDKAAQKMPLQRADKAPDDKKKDDKAAQKMPVQRATTAPPVEDDKQAQTKRSNPAQLDDKKEKKDDEKAAQMMPVQREAAGTTTAPPDVEQDMERQKHGGRPLTGAERQYFEPGFGADFSQVRVHDDAEAARAADSLNAKAFTQGSHIFFGSGYHQPNDTPGRQLMAHELTHTLQQGGAQPAAPTRPAPSAHAPAAPVQRQADTAAVENAPVGLIQRQPNAPAPGAGGGSGSTGSSTTPTAGGGSTAGADATQFDTTRGRLNTAQESITFDKIVIPTFKGQGHRAALYGSPRPLRRVKGYNKTVRRPNDQRDVWRRDLPTAGIEAVLRDKARSHDPAQAGYVFEMTVRGRSGSFYFFGSLTDIAKELTLPHWTGEDNPEYTDLQVDHILEIQLSNWGNNPAANTIANMELLRDSVNASSGTTIDNNIDARLRQFNEATNHAYARDESELRDKYHIDFERPDPSSGSDIRPNDFWKRDGIEQGKHLKTLREGSFENVGQGGADGYVLVFPSESGGQPKRFRWPKPLLKAEREWLDPFVISAKNFNTEGPNVEANPNFGSLTIGVPADAKAWKQEPPEPFDLSRAPGARFAGGINKEPIRRKLNKLRIKKMSPVEVTSMDITADGLVVRGIITCDIPILRGAVIDFSLTSGDITLSKTFATTDFTLPPPIRITNSALTLSISTRNGVGVSGRTDFEITNLGQGYLAAGASLTESLFLEGHFDFDSNLFQPAAITMRYRDGQFSGEGQIGIPSGKLKGIRSAQIDVSYAAGTFTANGTVQPNIPGVQQGTLNVVYSEQNGLVISGSLQLAENPAIRSGSIDARVEKLPDGSYKVRASGTAQPKIPGIDSALTVTYDDGAFDMEVTANFSRGMISGSLRAAATNRAVNPDTGQPGGDPTERITVYGGGSVTVRFAPWLQGTAGIKLLPNGEIEISGSIGLPNTVNLFDARRFDRNIFHVNIDIPIVGVSVAGQRIGIFATIGGGLDLRAGVGPGELRDLNLGVTYNPSHEDQTHITGHGEFVIPADAGLRLSIHGGIGAGIPIVSAEAGIEVSGELGLQGEARAAVDVDWTPQRGIVLDAEGSIFVEPRLKLDVSAYVSVKADLLLTTIDLYSKRWRLAGTEIGSNLRFGVTFPIHYEQGKPFSLSTDDVHFVIPEIDPQSVLSGILG